MTNQEIVEQLKQLKDQKLVVKGTLVLESNSVLETSYHSGTWNDHEFECCCLAYWNSAEVEVEINLEKLIELLENKGLNQFDHSDFDYVSLGEANNPDISVNGIEWMDVEPTEDEKVENDFEEIELYNNSDINDCECTFESGSVLSMKFIIERNSYIIDNTSDYPEENENNKKSIKIEIFSDGISNKIGNKLKYQKEISAFLKQWENTLCYFDDEFLVEDENGDVWILTYPNKPLIVSDNDLYNEDEYLASKDKAVIACLNNIIEFSSNCKFDLGEVGFEDGFYSAIVKLTQLQNDTNGFKLNAKIKTSEGEASGLFKFNELGKITASFNSNEIDGYDDKFLEEAIAEHNAHEEGFDLTSLNDLIKKFIDLTDYSEREHFYEANIKKFTEEDRIYIVENLDYYHEDNCINIHTMLEKIKNVDVLEKFALSGNYGTGAIGSVLGNKNCTEKIIWGVYKQPKESIIWKYALEYNFKKWGNDYYENISSQINERIEKGGKSCPVAETLDLITGFELKQNQIVSEDENNFQIFNKSSVERLSQYDVELSCTIKATLDSGTTEKGYGRGEYDGYSFELKYSTEWTAGYLESNDGITIADVIEVLMKKPLSLIDNTDFDLRLGEVRDGYNDIEVNWTNGEPDEVPDDEDLYRLIDIEDSNYEWECADCIEIKFLINNSKINITISDDEVIN